METQRKKEKIISKVAGEIEVTAEGWLHIKLNTLAMMITMKIS